MFAHYFWIFEAGVVIYFGWTKMKRLFRVEERRGSAPQPESPCEYLICVKPQNKLELCMKKKGGLQ